METSPSSRKQSLGFSMEESSYYLIEYGHQNASEGEFKDPFSAEACTTAESCATTDSVFTGELTITKLDFEEYMVSDTFWFDLEHPITGAIIQMRESRFDTYFIE